MPKPNSTHSQANPEAGPKSAQAPTYMLAWLCVGGLKGGVRVGWGGWVGSVLGGGGLEWDIWVVGMGGDCGDCGRVVSVLVTGVLLVCVAVVAGCCRSWGVVVGGG